MSSDPAARAALSAVCVEAETAFVGAPDRRHGPGGGAARARRPRAAARLPRRPVEHVPFDLAGAGLALLVIDTRVAHSNVDGRYGDRRRGCERAARLLGVRTLREVADATLGDDVEDALRPLAGDESAPLARHVVTEMRRVDAVVAELRAGRLDHDRPAARRLAPFAARRLRRVVPRARPRRRRSRSGRRARRADDGRRVRRFGDRARPGAESPRWRGRSRRRVRRGGLPAAGVPPAGPTGRPARDARAPTITPLLRAAGAWPWSSTCRVPPRLLHFGADLGGRRRRRARARSLDRARRRLVRRPVRLGLVPDEAGGWLGRPGLAGHRGAPAAPAAGADSATVEEDRQRDRRDH